MWALLTPSADDRPGFHSKIPVSELHEHDTRAIEASVVSSDPPVVETKDGVMHETWLTPTKLHRARGLKPPDPKLGDRVRRLAHEGPEAASRRTRAKGENTDEPLWLCPTYLEVDRVISTFSFDPNLEQSPQNPL